MTLFNPEIIQWKSPRNPREKFRPQRKEYQFKYRLPHPYHEIHHHNSNTIFFIHNNQIWYFPSPSTWPQKPSKKCSNRLKPNHRNPLHKWIARQLSWFLPPRHAFDLPCIVILNHQDFHWIPQCLSLAFYRFHYDYQWFLTLSIFVLIVWSSSLNLIYQDSLDS